MKKYSVKYFWHLLQLKIFLFGFLLFISEIVSAQTYSIGGKVVDSKSIPIPNVNITIINTSFGTATNDEGAYEILNLPSGYYTIEYSAIGYEKSRKENIIIQNKSKVIDVTLIESIILTDEVLVTAGKYEQKKSDLTVSTEVISGKEFSERNLSNLEDAVRYVPGVTMTEDQIIRGPNGYSRGTGSRALLAIDGLPFYTGDSGDIIWEMIPTLEIQRVEIINGASSSLYGSEEGNLGSNCFIKINNTEIKKFVIPGESNVGKSVVWCTLIGLAVGSEIGLVINESTNVGKNSMLKLPLQAD